MKYQQQNTVTHCTEIVHIAQLHLINNQEFTRPHTQKFQTHLVRKSQKFFTGQK